MHPIDEYDLMEALRASLEGELDVLGFLGRRSANTLVYLARALDKGTLVILVANSETDPNTQEAAVVWDVKDNLDASVPDVEARCPQCNATLRRWARFCSKCRADVTGISASTETNYSRQQLLEAVIEQAGAEYEVLGDIPRAEGGGMVYFARDVTSGRIVALRLNRDRQHEYSLNVTRVLQPIPARQADKPPTGPISINRPQRADLRALQREGRQSKEARGASARKAPLDRRLVTVGIVTIVLLLATLLALVG